MPPDLTSLHFLFWTIINKHKYSLPIRGFGQHCEAMCYNKHVEK